MMMWPTVNRPIRLGLGHHFGAHDQIFLFPFFCRTIALLFVLGRPLWREDGSVICSATRGYKYFCMYFSILFYVLRLMTWTYTHAQNNNQLIRDLFNQPEIGRGLNRMWPEDLIR
jgi:hypothetical protein